MSKLARVYFVLMILFVGLCISSTPASAQYLYDGYYDYYDYGYRNAYQYGYYDLDYGFDEPSGYDYRYGYPYGYGWYGWGW